MKLLLLFLIVPFVNGDIHMFDVFPKIAERCQKDVELIKEYAHLAEESYPLSHDAKCFLSCFHKIYKIQGENGNLTPETSVESVNGIVDPGVREKMKAMVLACDKEVKNDPDECITSENYAKCCVKWAIKIGLPSDKYMVTNLEDLL